MGPIAHWDLGVTGGVWAFIRAGLSQWVIELLDAGEKTGPFENENWVANVWKFQLLHGAIARRVLGVTRWVWAFIRAGLPQWVIELLDAGESRPV